MQEHTEQMLTDKLAQIIRVGFVNGRQPEKMRVKVTIPDTVGKELITDWLPVLCPRACEDMQYDLPDIGDQVLCLFLPYGLEQGFVVGAMYGKGTPPVQSGEKWHRKFKDGTWLEYDRATHKLTAYVEGDCEITAKGNISQKVEGNVAMQSQGPTGISSENALFMQAPTMAMSGKGGATKATMQGRFDLTEGDITAEGISLREHVHICPQCGMTGPPVASQSGIESASADMVGQSGNNNEDNSDSGSGGAENSVNYQAITEESIAPALQASGFILTPEREAEFERLRKEVLLQDNETFDTIFCLPKIAEAEASDRNPVDKLGWLYLKAMCEKWLSGLANEIAINNNEPLWVSMDWALSYYRTRCSWNKLIANLFSENAKLELFNSVKKAGLLTGKKEEFKFTKSEWPEWESYYFQREPVFGMDAIYPDGLMAAMGTFDLRALPDGTVEPSDNGYRITVQNVAIYIHDSFNFEGYAPLGYWSCVHESFQNLDPDEAVYLYNSDFRLFRETTNFGEDFLILSLPKPVDSFTAVTYEIS